MQNRRKIIGKAEKAGKDPYLKIIIALLILFGLLRTMKSYPILIVVPVIFAVFFYFRIKNRKAASPAEDGTDESGTAEECTAEATEAADTVMSETAETENTED